MPDEWKRKKTKSEFYAEARTSFSNDQVQLPDNERLRVQLLGLVRRADGGGRETVDHPVGGHDDIANAVAIALTMASLDDDPTNIWFELAAAEAYENGDGPRPALWGPPLPGEIPIPPRVPSKPTPPNVGTLAAAQIGPRSAAISAEDAQNGG